MAKRRRVRRRNPNQEERDFYTWVHDFKTLLEAALRQGNVAPARVIAFCAEGADAMRSLVEARKPAEPKGPKSRRRGRRRFTLAKRRWYEWQDLFDHAVHALVIRSELTTKQVVARALAVADKAIAVVDIKRPGWDR
jgi:hypothetical protein